jgi:hypothetical protein
MTASFHRWEVWDHTTRIYNYLSNGEFVVLLKKNDLWDLHITTFKSYNITSYNIIKQWYGSIYFWISSSVVIQMQKRLG